MKATSFAAVVLAVCTAGCTTVNEIAPKISNVQPFPDGSTSGSLVSTAEIDPKAWGYADPYLTFASNAASVGTSAARIVEPTCTPIGGSVVRCEARKSFSAGRWFYQWHLDYGRTSADVAMLSRPNPPLSFKVAASSSVVTCPDGTRVLAGTPCRRPPLPSGCTAPLTPLAVSEPGDGAQPVGTQSWYKVSVWLKWQDPNQPRCAYYQVVLEEVGGDQTCSDYEQSGALDLDAPNAALRQDDCIVEIANFYEHAFSLAPGTQYRWRVRPMLDDQTFGTFTQDRTFTTLSLSE
jgi:hypothetical protein